MKKNVFLKKEYARNLEVVDPECEIILDEEGDYDYDEAKWWLIEDMEIDINGWPRIYLGTIEGSDEEDIKNKAEMEYGWKHDMYNFVDVKEPEKLPPMSKESFIRSINKMKECDRKIQNIEKVLMENCDDAIFCPPSLETEMIQMLKDLFHDESSWIEYYIFDLDFGEKWEEGMITETGKSVSMRTPEELYDILIQNLN